MSLWLWLSVALAAQFGPKDHRELPPFDLERVRPGDVAPDFTLPGTNGEPVSLSDYRGKNVVLVFYRGYW
ncbi:MAG: redoxin domain-containing protein [Bryobacteraceae bacterium]|nr:redoxin domain-containing protein [Bryobacteraceae bacterium]